MSPLTSRAPAARATPLRRLSRHLPRPARVLLGVVCTLLGLWLLTRPLTSATLLTLFLGVGALAAGVAELGRDGAGVRRWPRRLRACVLLALGTVAVLAPAYVVPALVLLVAAALLLSGVSRVGELRVGTAEARATAGLLLVAEVVLGALALLWPDVTLVGVAVLFGVRLVVTGALVLVEAVRGRDLPGPGGSDGEPGAPPGRLARPRRLAVASLALLVALGALALTGQAKRQAPAVDDFSVPPGEVPSEPGRLLRAEPFSREVPAGARGWRILHTTTDHDGEPTVATALVVAPVAGDEPRPVVAWAHGTTGQARHCAPSLLAEPFTAGAFPAVAPDVVDRGWAVVAPDYVGLGAGEAHAYLVGRVAGRAVLDAVRAARELDEARLGDETVVWGHSQGGAAALWTAQEQPAYAPDVPLRGTVAMAPASDPLTLAEGLSEVTGGSVFAAYVIQGYAAAYDDVRLGEVVRPAARTLVPRLASRCLAEPGVLASVLTALSLRDEDVLRADAARGPLGRRLAENVPLAPGEGALLVANGSADTLITPAVQRDYVRRVRATGRGVELRLYPGLDHMGLVQEGSALLPELLAWTEERFSS